MKILVSALEHSANVHLQSLKDNLGEEVEFIGIFNKALGEPIIDLRNLAIMGIVDALKKLRFFLKLNTQMLDLAQEADKVLLIDSSGFNLPLAKKIKKKYPNKEIIYYILPQAWAWKKKRIPVLAQTVDKLCSILPFEPDYYPKNAPITYVGHPLLDQITTFKTAITQHVQNIVFMPGSRKTEITNLMPIYRAVLAQLNANATIIIPSFFTQEEVESLYGDLSDFNVQYNAHEALLNADFAFICSGTATLEAAIIGTPFILTYIAKKFDFFIGNLLVGLEYVGLANIMFQKEYGRSMHPEFLQNEVTVSNLVHAFENYKRAHFLEDSQKLREYLQHGSSQNVAKIIKE